MPLLPCSWNGYVACLLGHHLFIIINRLDKVERSKKVRCGSFKLKGGICKNRHPKNIRYKYTIYHILVSLRNIS